MDLAQLIVTLKPLLGDTDGNWPKIAKLLESHSDLAEYEVARHFVNNACGGSAKDMLRNLDPKIRIAGIKRVAALYPRSQAERALRAMVLDSNFRVRATAIAKAWRLGLDDVALPDSRRGEQDGERLWRVGGWNPTGWLFGHNVFTPSRTSELGRRGLPSLANRAAVAAFLNVDDDELTRYLRPGVGAGAGYLEFEIAKATGGTRRIAAPRPGLRAAQRVILEKLLNKLPVHDACHGFVAKRSIVSNARPHVGAAVIVKMDLRDFFPTIHYRRVAGFFRLLGYGHEVARLFAGLLTHRPKLDDGRVAWPGVLPQGAPTSPALANQIAGRLDSRLSGLATKTGARYTRYADDLTFSFALEPEVSLGRFCWWVDQICGQEGFAENSAKRRILRQSNQQRVTGVVVNSQLSVPRAARRRFRATLHNCRKNGLAAEAREHDDMASYLRGFAAFVTMVQPSLGAKWAAEVEAVIAVDGSQPSGVT